MDVRVEGDPVGPLPGYDDDEALRGDPTQLGERGAEVLHVLEGVRRHDGVERIVGEGKALDVRFAEDRATMADRAIAGCQGDVDADDAVVTGQHAPGIPCRSATSSTVSPSGRRDDGFERLGGEVGVALVEAWSGGCGRRRRTPRATA